VLVQRKECGLPTSRLPRHHPPTELGINGYHELASRRTLRDRRSAICVGGAHPAYLVAYALGGHGYQSRAERSICAIVPAVAWW